MTFLKVAFVFPLLLFVSLICEGLFRVLRCLERVMAADDPKLAAEVSAETDQLCEKAALDEVWDTLRG